MPRKKLVDIDLNKNSLNNARIQNLSSDPSTPVVGQTYFNTASNKLRTYNGATWDEYGTSGATGTVTGVSVVSANGIAGTVATPSTTPAITLSTSVTGVLKGNGTAISAAVAGTDYAAATSGSGILKGNGAGGTSTATAGTDFSAGTSALATGIVRTTTTTGALTIAVAADFPTLNQATTSTAANVTGVVAVANGGTNASNAANARTNLGLVIGTDVLAPNGSGAALTGITQSQVASLVTDLGLKANLASPTFTGTVTVPTPVNATDPATKGYTDGLVQGVRWKQEVRAATTTAGTLATSFANASVIDGVTLATGDRILVKDQAAGADNGIYTVNATGAPTRGTDADTATEIRQATTFVQEGTVNADSQWVVTNDGTITLGTTALVWALAGNNSVVTATTSVAGKVQLATQAEAQAKANTAKALTAASVADFTRKFTGTIGDGTATAIAVTHGLGSQFVIADIYEVSSNLQVESDVTLTSATQTTFTFNTAPTTNQYRVVIVG